MKQSRKKKQKNPTEYQNNTIAYHSAQHLRVCKGSGHKRVQKKLIFPYKWAVLLLLLGIHVKNLIEK
jgi:hypothetical protein